MLCQLGAAAPNDYMSNWWVFGWWVCGSQALEFGDFFDPLPITLWSIVSSGQRNRFQITERKAESCAIITDTVTAGSQRAAKAVRMWGSQCKDTWGCPLFMIVRSLTDSVPRVKHQTRILSIEVGAFRPNFYGNGVILCQNFGTFDK